MPSPKRKTPEKLGISPKERDQASGLRKNARPPPDQPTIGPLILIKITSQAESTIELLNISQKIIYPDMQITPDSEIAIAVSKISPGESIDIVNNGNPRRITLLAKQP